MRGELKQKLRGLKRFELRLRFGGVALQPEAMPILVYDSFFNLKGGSAKYSLSALMDMDRAAFSAVIEEYVAEVYFRVYGFRETDDFSALNALGLPFDADLVAIKRRFRVLAKETHPDVGGDAEAFVRLKAQYDELIRASKA